MSEANILNRVGDPRRAFAGIERPPSLSFGQRMVAGFMSLTSGLTALMLTASFVFALGILSIVVYQKVNNYHSHAVLSGSMVPTLPIGGLIVTETVGAEKLQVGDIVTFHPPGREAVLITHRILNLETEISPAASAGDRFFFTKGDANPIRDPWRVSARSGTFEREVNVIPYAGYVAVWMQSRAARLVLLIGPAVLLALIVLMEIWTPRPQARK